MKNTALKAYILFFFLYSNSIIWANPGSENDTSNLEATDAVAAPIDNYVWLVALMGFALVFRVLKKHKTEIEFKN